MKDKPPVISLVEKRSRGQAVEDRWRSSPSLICIAATFVLLGIWPVRAAELPKEMLGAWCFDKLMTRALAAEGEYYHARAAHGNDCANRGGYAIWTDGLTSYRFGPQQVCKFDKIEPVGGGAYHVSMTCKRVADPQGRRGRNRL